MGANLTILQKGLALLALPLLFQLAFVYRVAALERQERQAEEASAHQRAVLDEGQRVLRELVDAETGIRGFLLTENALFTEPYDRARQDLPASLRRLEDLVGDNPDQAAHAAAITEAARNLLAWHAKTHELARGTPEQRDEAHRRNEESRQRMDRLREQLDTFMTEEGRLHEARRHELEETRQRLPLLVVAGITVAFGGTGLLGIIFTRRVAQRLAILTSNLRRLAGGQALAPPIGGGDELARLDRAFHQMAEEVTHSREDLRRLNEELEARVRARTAELTDLNKELAQKNQENELFVYSVSHDLRSPLVNLQGFGKELGLVCGDLRALLTGPDVPPAVRERATALLDRDAAQALHFIQTAVRRLAGIIDALLRLSRVGRVEYRPQEVDVQAVLRRVTDALHATLAERGAVVEVGELPPAWGDATALEQVFANLVANALNYLDPARPGRIAITSVSAPAGRVAYAVRDNGRGIPPAYLHKLFQPFQRLHPEAAAGEGIGLTIVSRILERLRGTIRVESEEGVGSTFIVELPNRPG